MLHHIPSSWVLIMFIDPSPPSFLSLPPSSPSFRCLESHHPLPQNQGQNPRNPEGVHRAPAPHARPYRRVHHTVRMGRQRRHCGGLDTGQGGVGRQGKEVGAREGTGLGVQEWSGGVARCSPGGRRHRGDCVGETEVKDGRTREEASVTGWARAAGAGAGAAAAAENRLKRNTA